LPAAFPCATVAAAAGAAAVRVEPPPFDPPQPAKAIAAATIKVAPSLTGKGYGGGAVPSAEGITLPPVPLAATLAARS
jgi:hypothetical protein